MSTQTTPPPTSGGETNTAASQSVQPPASRPVPEAVMLYMEKEDMMLTNRDVAKIVVGKFVRDVASPDRFLDMLMNDVTDVLYAKHLMPNNEAEFKDVYNGVLLCCAEMLALATAMRMRFAAEHSTPRASSTDKFPVGTVWVAEGKRYRTLVPNIRWNGTMFENEGYGAGLRMTSVKGAELGKWVVESLVGVIARTAVFVSGMNSKFNHQGVEYVILNRDVSYNGTTGGITRVGTDVSYAVEWALKEGWIGFAVGAPVGQPPSTRLLPGGP